MTKQAAMAALAVLALSAATLEASSTVDLSARGALEELRQTNPEHYAIIREAISGLTEQPARAEGDWLQVTFGAQDVVLSRFTLMTSYPPRQSLVFSLDDVRYRLYVVRRDIDAEFEPIR